VIGSDRNEILHQNHEFCKQILLSEVELEI
jgi:hypothetical protein